jgi:hypothetical protein
MDEIVNRVAQSALMVFDLEDYYPKQVKSGVDIAQWLEEGFLLKEKDFREALKDHDWTQYRGHRAAVYCSTDAILPAWAPILVSSYLASEAYWVVLDSPESLDAHYYQYILEQLDYSSYADKPVILKGCSKKPVPESAYVAAIQKLQKVAKSIMYGEACSAVPLYKKSTTKL